MRLIDADKWIKDLTEIIKNTSSEYQDIFCLFISEIRKRPTAYNIDKVIARLSADIKFDTDADTGEFLENWVTSMQNDLTAKHIHIVSSGLQKDGE